MRILYAEDDRDIASAIMEILSMEGHEITHVLNGLDAYEMLKLKTFDMLLTDHMMPELRGAELVLKLRKEGNHIPVLINSGSLHLEHDYDCLKTFEQCKQLPKPMDLDQLIETIKEYENGKH